MPIVPALNFNPNALTADDLYIAIQNPPGFIMGVPTDVFAAVGTASWGPVSKPVHMGSPFDALQGFGPISAASLTDAHDLATDLAIAFGQASGSNNEGWGVRVTDGTDTQASGAIAGAATSNAELATIGGTIANGDSVVLTITQSALVGSPLSLTIPIVTADTLTTVAAKLAAAINANAALAVIGVWASSASAVCSVYQPAALSPQATFGKTDGASATVTLSTGTPATGGATIKGLYTGSLANGASGLQALVSAGAAANTWTVQLAFPALNIQEIYPNLPTSGFWAALVNAINTGLSGVRGPSQIATAVLGNGSVGAPTPGTYQCSGGTDGRAGVALSQMLGSDSASPKTGLYSLRALNPAVGIVWLVGMTDTTAAASLVAFATSEGCSVLEAMAAGTSTAAALSQVSSVGAHDPSFAWTKDWIYFFDPVNAVTRLVSPNAFIGGYVATLSPAQSPGNKQVQLVVGTERNNPQTGNVPYTESEVGQLASAGVMFIANPIPAGATFGIRHGQTTSLQPATAPFEYWRMTCFLARSFASTLGQFVDQLQSQQANDPLRNAVKHQINDFLNSLKGSNGQVGLIDDFTTICTFNSASNASPGNGVNTPASVAAHYLYVLVRVRYLSSVRFFILSLQGGTTVVTVGATPGQQNPGN